MSEAQEKLIAAVRQLGKEATFENLVGAMKGEMNPAQVRGTVAACVKAKLLRKGAGGVYRKPKRRRAKAKRQSTRANGSVRRSSIVVAADAMAKRATEVAAAAKKIGDLVRRYPELSRMLSERQWRKRKLN